MNEEKNKEIDKEKLRKEKKELKMLERFQYDNKESSLRASTKKIINQSNYYTDLIRGIPKINASDCEKKPNSLTKKKRGRKPKNFSEISEQNKKGMEKSSTTTAGKSGDKVNADYVEVDTKESFDSLVKNMNELSKNAAQNEGSRNGNNIECNSWVSCNENNNSARLNKINKISAYKSESNNFSNLNFSLVNQQDYSNFITVNAEMKSKYENEFPLEADKLKKSNSEGETSIQAASGYKLNSKTFINCDLRYFNFSFLKKRLGSFDAIMIDPPWRIKGGQRNDTSYMFSNSKFSLEYNTLANNDIISLSVEELSDKGFCFLWVLNSLLKTGLDCLNKWGYEVVDQIQWIKLRNDNKIFTTQGYYFLHSYETCLVGYKCPVGSRMDYKSKVANNLLFAKIRGKSQKPQEIYELIEKMLPGSKKIELFARNNNLREGWFSMGNQLGETYQSWKNIVNCDKCERNIEVGVKRHKSRITANYDLCATCHAATFEEIAEFSGHNKKDFFALNNDIDEDVLHQYFACDVCHSEPIWGNRFSCKTCGNYDLCEACFDKEIEKIQEEANTHIKSHEISCLEVPDLTFGLPFHSEYKCSLCYQKPIIGPCFECLDCKSFTVCQNCYFNSSMLDKRHQEGGESHRFEIRMKKKTKISKYVKCNGCSIEPIENYRFRCNTCFDFNLCEDCYANRKTNTFIGNSHKNFHDFTGYVL